MELFDYSKKKEEKKQIKFNPEDFVNELEFENIDERLLNLIDESDLPIPSNFIEFATSKKFLNTSVLPRQIQIISQFYGEMCPHCSNKKAMSNLYDQDLEWIYDNIVFLRNGVCPSCHKNRLDFMKEGLYNFPDSLYVCCGQRSGKSIMGGGLIPHYLTARLICLQNKKGKRVIPYKYFHNPPAPFYGTFTAVSLGQAYDNLWQPFKGYLDSPWWKLYFEILDYYGKKHGIELYKNNTTYLQLVHKKLAWLCEPPSKKKLRGKTRFYFGIDEVSWHDLGTKDDSILGSAKEVMAAGRNSLLTYRKKSLDKLEKGNFNVPMGIECYCSSPAEANDILMRKVREAKSNPRMLAFHYATWEFNPDYRSPADIGESDPMILMRDFGANPPLADKQFYSDAKNLVEMIGTKGGMVNYKIVEDRDTFGNFTYYPVIESFNYTNTYPKILTLDNGQVNNSFSAIVMHKEKDKIVNDFIVTVKPTKNHKVNLGKCFNDFIMNLVYNKQVNIVMVSYDRWNSAQAIDTLNEHKIKALQYSLKYQDFLDIRSSFGLKAYIFNKTMLDATSLINYEGGFDFLNMSEKDPYFGLLYQILTVRDFGKTLGKPSMGDDDIWRAFALGATLLKKEEYKDLFEEHGNASYSSDRAFGAVACSRGHRPSSSTPAEGILGGLARKKH